MSPGQSDQSPKGEDRNGLHAKHAGGGAAQQQAPNTISNTVQGTREAIARIIDPAVWKYRDDCLAHPERFEDVKDVWDGMTFEQWANRGTSETLAKADRILSLAKPIADVDVREAVELAEARLRAFFEANDWRSYARPMSPFVDIATIVSTSTAPELAAKQAFTFAFARGFQVADETSRSCISAMDDAWEEYCALTPQVSS